MNIGIDIDGVLVNDDDYILDNATKFMYENNIYNVKDLDLYEYNKFNWDQDTLDKYRKEYYRNYLSNEIPRKYASEVINKLKKNHKIYIITSRYETFNDSRAGEEVRNRTIKWLKENDIYYDRICFSNDKTKQIKMYNIDVMIEDNPEKVMEYKNLTKVLLYDCRYNKSVKDKNIFRVYSWYDILEKISNM